MNHRSPVPAPLPRRVGAIAALTLSMAMASLAGCSSDGGTVTSSGSTGASTAGSAGSAGSAEAPPQQTVADGGTPAVPSGPAGYTGGSLKPTMAGNPKASNKGLYCKLVTRAQAGAAFGTAVTSMRPHTAGDNPGGKVVDGCVYVAGSSMISYEVLELAAAPADPLAAVTGRLPSTGVSTPFDPKVGTASVGAQVSAPGNGTVVVVAASGRREVVVTATLKSASAARTAAVSTATTLLRAKA